MGVIPGFLMICLAACVLLPSVVAAETPDWLFPERSLLTGLRAGPRDPATQSQIVYDWDNPSEFGAGVAGEAAISASAAVLRLAGRDADDALIVGLESAAFARFSFQVVTRELVNTDWIFTVPLVWHRGRHWFRWRYYHTSSHLGDEYQRRFGPSSINFSRDGADLSAFLGLTQKLGVYGLVFLSANSHPEQRRLWELRTGVELDPGEGRLWQPFLSADIHGEQGADWEPRLTVQCGLWLPHVQGRPLQLALQGIVGPSPLGQFREHHSGRLGLGIFWNP
mgnify:CR=1 FL=1